MSNKQEEHWQGVRITWIGVVVNLVLTGLKMLAGIYGHSQAMVADAVHSLSDLLTDGVVLFGLRFGRKEADAEHHFGHERIETLSSAFIGIALVVVAVGIGWSALRQMLSGEDLVPNGLAIAGAALSIVAKEVLYQYTVVVGRRIRSAAVVANAWHHRSDALSSIAVLVGVTAAQLNPDWHILDAVAALVVSFMIVHVGLKILLDALKEVIDTAPGKEVLGRIESIVTSVTGVGGFHGLRVRTTGGLLHIQVHIEVDGEITVAGGHDIADTVEHELGTQMEVPCDVIVHVDPLGAESAGHRAPVGS